MTEVVLTYKRAAGDLSTGWITVGGQGSSGVLLTFVDATFATMMTRFAEVLKAHPDASAIIRRNDRGGLQPFTLDQKTAELLRTDPVQAIRALSFEVPQPSPDRRKRLPSSGLVVGHDTLADAFGEYLYTRYRGGKAECPGCGRWAPVVADVIGCACLPSLPVELAESWARCRTEVLLQLPHKSFYFPRLWNNHRSWVTRVDLAEKFNQYKKEKEEACSLRKV